MDERWTEVVVAGIHREAMSALIGRRAADYLAAELRGQLLSRTVELVVEDRMSRGRSQKIIPVKPPRFLGERLEGIGPVEVPGHPPIRLEVYLAGQAQNDDVHAGLAVYSAGTLVAPGFDGLAALSLDHPPWTDRRLSGIIDFPAFRVAPGSRRGVVVDEQLCTSAPDVYAAGDVAEFEGRVYGIIPAAIEQARIAAANMVNDGSAIYSGTVPATTLKVVGIDLSCLGDATADGDEVLVLRRSDEAACTYRRLTLRDGKLVGAISLGDRKSIQPLKQLIATGRDVSAYTDRLLDENFNTLAKV